VLSRFAVPALEQMRVLGITPYEAGTTGARALSWPGADAIKGGGGAPPYGP